MLLLMRDGCALREIAVERERKIILTVVNGVSNGEKSARDPRDIYRPNSDKSVDKLVEISNSQLENAVGHRQILT